MNSKRILLVEDEATIASLYRTLLERTGAKVTVVTDGSDAFMEAHHQPYDVIILDLMLPNMDGLAILRRLRAQRRFTHIPIFLYTSAEMAQVEPMALEAGANKVFSKALPAKTVVTAITEFLLSLRPKVDRTPDESGEGDPRGKPDFRVKTDKPADPAAGMPRLRMVEPPPEPPKPRLPAPVRKPIEFKQQEEEPPKKGLLSRWFQSKDKDTDE